jgi:hypothetical protein
MTGVIVTTGGMESASGVGIAGASAVGNSLALAGQNPGRHPSCFVGTCWEEQ